MTGIRNWVYTLSCLCLMVSCLTAQETEVTDDGMSKLLHRYNRMSVPYLSVESLKMDYDQYKILDTRKKEEYEVSHLPGAIWVGEKLNTDLLPDLSNDQKILVYCSVGVRSEDFGEELQELGYTEVYNLYGSIFAWKNAGFTVVNNNGQVTEKVHTYNKYWSRFLMKGEPVY
ncbi:rhodanese-like domain-containing protein [Nonlabens xiamenensis]|uniref:rhodanese-like domain-containing protein n=1 Tax=Nonlabens xiamenensis TaxID=2341043 RepID=UPI001F0C0015|nr:rhodanese-like domain-containing protein [Nonlabens xiamenensis]